MYTNSETNHWIPQNLKNLVAKSFLFSHRNFWLFKRITWMCTLWRHGELAEHSVTILNSPEVTSLHTALPLTVESSAQKRHQHHSF